MELVLLSFKPLMVQQENELLQNDISIWSSAMICDMKVGNSCLKKKW